MGVVQQVYDRLTGETVALKQIKIPLQHTPLTTHNDQTKIDTGRDYETTVISDTRHAYTKTEPDSFDPYSPKRHSETTRLRFAQEFQILASLRHPYIVSVLDYGFDYTQNPYFTMEYIADAKTISDAAKRLNQTQKLDLIGQVLQALLYLHRRNVLHKDLKPTNILVSNHIIRIVDFGLSTTKSDLISLQGGTIPYMAPELLRDYQLYSFSADLYAVGIIMYEVLAGHHPFKNIPDNYSGLPHDAEYDLSHLGLSPALESVLSTLLAKDPLDRYHHASTAWAQFNQARERAIPPESRAIRESFLQAASFVGRSAELGKLKKALNTAKQGNEGVWLIGGESGVGKSRLIDELRTQALVSGWQVVRGQAIEGGAIPYQLWRDPLPQLILNSDINDLDAGVLRTIVPHISRLLDRDISTPPQLEREATQERLILTLISLLYQQTQPTLLLLEDLQWSNQSSLDVVSRVARLANKHQLLIIGTYRDDDRPHLPQELPDTVHTIKLERFTDQAIIDLCKSMLGDISNQTEVVDFLKRETEGNAYFLVEIVRALAEEAGRLEAISTVELPLHIFTGGITQIIQRRLNAVPTPYHKLLKLAAVSDREIDLSLMEELVQEIPLNLWLSTCNDAAVLEIKENKWRFTHDKLRTTLISNMTQREQPQLHQQIAKTIENVYPNDLAQAYRLANHWHIAGNQEREQVHTYRAGQYSASQYANSEAVTFLSRALALTPDQDKATQYDILLARERVYGFLGNREMQRQDLNLLAQLADLLYAQGIADFRMIVALQGATYAEATGDYKAAIIAAKRVIDLAKKAKNREIEAAGGLAWGRALVRQGQYAAAQEKLTLATAQSEVAQDENIRAQSLRWRGTGFREIGEFASARQYYAQALEIFHALQDAVGESEIVNNLAIIAHLQGDTATALTNWDAARELNERMGHREGMARIQLNMGGTYSDCGQYDKAQQLLNQALSLFQEIEMPLGVCYVHLNLSYLHTKIGKLDAAVTYGREGLQIAQEINSRSLQSLAYINLGEAYLAQNAFSKGIEAYQQVIDLWQEQKNPGQIMEGLAGLALTHHQQAHDKEALSQVEQILVLIDQGESVPANIVYLACYHVLNRQKDPRRQALLTAAYNAIQQRANQITDPDLRQSYLTHVAVHQELIALFRQQEN